MRVGLLGPLEVHEGDHRIHVGSTRQRAALAMLALDAGRVVSADRLIDGLWGDSALAGALNALQHRSGRWPSRVPPGAGPGAQYVSGQFGLLQVEQRREILVASPLSPCVDPHVTVR